MFDLLKVTEKERGRESQTQTERTELDLETICITATKSRRGTQVGCSQAGHHSVSSLAIHGTEMHQVGHAPFLGLRKYQRLGRDEEGAVWGYRKKARSPQAGYRAGGDTGLNVKGWG